MRPGALVVAVLLTLALEMSLKPVFVLNHYANVSPSFMIVLLVYVALLAPQLPLLWAALLMGVLMDLTEALQAPGGGIVYLIGPNALGYVATAFLITQMRSVVFRQRLITMVVFTFLAFLMVAAIRIMLLCVRGWFGESLVWGGGSFGGELLRVLLVAVYSSLIAIPFGWFLQQSTPAWGFLSWHSRGASWR